jgi:nitric oxide dioxygenase
VHGCRNERVHAFKNRLRELSEANSAFQNHLFYEQKEAENENIKCGIVDLQQIEDKILLEDANYYLCGPAGFIRKQYEYLKQVGVDPSSIHFEEFGPASLSLN